MWIGLQTWPQNWKIFFNPPFDEHPSDSSIEYEVKAIIDRSLFPGGNWENDAD